MLLLLARVFVTGNHLLDLVKYHNEKSTNAPKVDAKETAGSVLTSGPESIILGILFDQLHTLRPHIRCTKSEFPSLRPGSTYLGEASQLILMLFCTPIQPWKQWFKYYLVWHKSNREIAQPLITYQVRKLAAFYLCLHSCLLFKNSSRLRAWCSWIYLRFTGCSLWLWLVAL